MDWTETECERQRDGEREQEMRDSERPIVNFLVFSHRNKDRGHCLTLASTKGWTEI